MNCPICEFEGVDHEVLNAGELWEIKCKRCGNYKSTDSAKGMLESLPESDKIRLSIIIRNSNLGNRELFEFNIRNIKEIIDSYIELTVPEKIDKLQLNLAKSVNRPNDQISIDESIDWPLAYAEDQTEISYYLKYLEEKRLIQISEHIGNVNLLNITVPGWSSISELQKKITTSNNAFVAMNFEEEFDDLYEHSIKNAIVDNGYNPIISKRAEHIDLIDDFIMAEIKNSRFVVAEFTGQKHGVYFEAGYARGLGKPVIWVCNKNEIDKLHFDINHYNQIDWETSEELERRLYNRIRAVI